MKKILIALGLTACIAATCIGHSGGTDANGGHYNRKTGEYHYHGSKAIRKSAPRIVTQSKSKDTKEKTFWLNTGSNTRHNSRCRYYNNTKRGRPCTKIEGKACGICGG